MTYGLRWSDEGDADLRETADWYEARQPGLGDRFLAAVYNALDTVTTFPHGFPQTLPGIRRVRLNGFPYRVFYIVLEERIVKVIAVWHDDRDPAGWTARLT